MVAILQDTWKSQMTTDICDNNNAIIYVKVYGRENSCKDFFKQANICGYIFIRMQFK